MTPPTAACWLITGGAGYIGAHVTRAMLSAGFAAVVMDDLRTGLPDRLPSNVPLVVGDCADPGLVHETVSTYGCVGVLHLAALKQARESVRKPVLYWGNNLRSALGVFEGVMGSGVRSLVLSSSCSVYGAAGAVTEDTPVAPESPYGRTKLATEQALRDTARESGIAWMSLRYFNVIGNEDHPSAHDTSAECLVPATYRAVASGRAPVVFGTDYATPDGSALRDYVDVRDLAHAHVQAARRLEDGALREGDGVVLNVGTGRPTSVLDVVRAVHAAAGRAVRYESAARQPGDPAAVWAESPAAGRELDWIPTHDLVASVTAHVASVERERRE